MSRTILIPVRRFSLEDPHIPAELKAKLEVALAESIDILTREGYDTVWVHPTASGSIAPIVEALKARKPDGVIVGYGIRGSKELTGMFEEIVNAVVKEGRGAKLMFNTVPQDGIESARRWVPLKKD